MRESYARVQALVASKRVDLDSLARALLEVETLDAKQVHEAIANGGAVKPTKVGSEGAEGGDKSIPIAVV